MTHVFTCCPECGSPFYLERVGVVGRRGIRDSRIMKCTVCNITFRTKSQSIWESLGRHKNVE